ncbi:MAG: hypothetical protein AAFN78_09660, partial [Pseudomonadota bacterium]
EADWDSDPKWAYVRARGRPGWIRKSHIRQKSWTYNGLLEFYVIDVGQGDGVLCRTPDDRWHLIDAGRPNSHQMTKKGAANFLRWKFYRDLGMDRIKLHSLTASHSDFDHYGGMLDLLSGELYDGRTFDVEVAHFYHNGMGRFVGDDPLGKLKSGAIGPLPNDHYDIATHDHFIVDLLDDKDSFAAAGQSFSSSFGELAALVGSKCESAQRLSLADGHLPDYAPGESDVSVRILGPVVEQFGRQQGLRRLGSGREWESKTRNGHSLVFRFDYGNARILMTGDLNEESQRLLLSYTNADEFAVDVAKGCHHGSEDVNIGFIKAIKARATAISSGDNESYAHPRPVLLGASARYGRESKTPDGKVMAPLLYSTELARSVKLAYPTSVKLDPDFSGPQEERWFSAKKTKIKSSSTRYRKLDTTPIATDLVYGLVNVRTDGNTILCATMEESGGDFDTKLFKAGVDVEE